MRNNVPTILIVEDDERIRNLMRTVLTGAGYATLETGKAATAVSMLASHSPDLMLLDLGLPDRDGQELLSDIRTWSSVPVVVASSAAVMFPASDTRARVAATSVELSHDCWPSVSAWALFPA